MSTPLPGLNAVIYDYDPDRLTYTLQQEPDFVADHPLDRAGALTPAVGVHGVHSTGPGAGALLWHEVVLAHWTGTRAEFAAASQDVRSRALAIGPAFDAGRWGTHLGATLAVRTADEKVVLRSRAGKYAEAHLFDSLVAGTMLMPELTGTTDEYLLALARHAGVGEADIAEFHPTHLAMRTADFGLWIGGWLRLNLDADAVVAAAPFETRVLDLGADVDVPLTDWGAVDLALMGVHAAGHVALPDRVHAA